MLYVEVEVVVEGEQRRGEIEEGGGKGEEKKEEGKIRKKRR